MFPMTDRLYEMLKKLEQNRNDSERVFWRFDGWACNISKRFQRLRKKVNELPDNLTTHTLRHTLTSHKVMQDVDLSTVTALMGHSTIQVTEQYAHLQPDHKMLAANKLPF